MLYYLILVFAGGISVTGGLTLRQGELVIGRNGVIIYGGGLSVTDGVSIQSRGLFVTDGITVCNVFQKCSGK